jgi:2,3-bisphosphoglycerate-independent phosphoglycerate mutase
MVTKSSWKIAPRVIKPPSKAKSLKKARDKLKAQIPRFGDEKEPRPGKRFGKKVVFIVIDGLADTPSAKDGKTPLSEAKTPNMDWFTNNGACGQLELVTKALWETIDQRGVSQYANVSLLGYSPERYPLERGPLEVLGAGLPFTDGNLAVRFNFSTVDNEMKVVDRRVGRAIFGLDDIAQYINQHVDVGVRHFFMRTYGHRGVLVLQDNLPANLEGNDTPKGEVVKKVKALDSASERSAKLLQEFVDKARDVMQFNPMNSERMAKGLMPANFVMLRGAGNHLPVFPNFSTRWNIRKAACIAENGVMKATCMTAGFSSITVPEFEDKESKLDHLATLDFIFDGIDSALAEYDFVYAHIKAADEAAHDRDFERKKRVIEAIDSKMEALRKFDGILVITCDHITSSATGHHERGLVPVVVYGKRKDAVKKFDEESVKKGTLKVMSGHDLLNFVFGK